MVSILARKGILPDDHQKYTATEIYNAIWDHVKVNPILDCVHNTVSTLSIDAISCAMKNRNGLTLV